MVACVRPEVSWVRFTNFSSQLSFWQDDPRSILNLKPSIHHPPRTETSLAVLDVIGHCAMGSTLLMLTIAEGFGLFQVVCKANPSSVLLRQFKLTLHVGLLPRIDKEFITLPQYKPNDPWSAKKAILGQNDYIGEWHRSLILQFRRAMPAVCMCSLLKLLHGLSHAHLMRRWQEAVSPLALHKWPQDPAIAKAYTVPTSNNRTWRSAIRPQASTASILRSNVNPGKQLL